MFIFKKFKQYKGTVSKEWPDSIIAETLKNKILIPIDSSKESDFYAGFKNISFTKFNLISQKLQAWEYLPYFQKMGKHPLQVMEY